jgi:ABC-type branched-subunit amino acid transport system substrate-binding protein
MMTGQLRGQSRSGNGEGNHMAHLHRKYTRARAAVAALTFACLSAAIVLLSISPAGAAPRVTVSGPGVTAHRITIANISDITGFLPGLFLGSQIGTEAYVAYTNAHGGVDGRQLYVDAEDTGENCTTAQSLATSSVTSVFAFVGETSIYDSCDATVLQQNPGVPDVSYTFDPTTGGLPNFYSGDPYQNSVATGQLLYLKKKYPTAIQSVGIIYSANVASQITLQVAAMKAVGYNVIFEDAPPTVTPATATADVVRMRSAGVQFVALTSENDTATAAFLNAAQQQGWAPQVFWNTGTAYDTTFASEIQPQAAQNLVITTNLAPFREGDNSSNPGVRLFNNWVDNVRPGFVPDVWAAYSWASTALFVQALKNAGPHVTQASVLAALKKIKSFDADGLQGNTDPGARTPTKCFEVLKYSGTVRSGDFVQVDAPPKGKGYFTCDGTLYGS